MSSYTIPKRFFSTRSYKPPTKEIMHPFITEPEHLSLNPIHKSAKTQGLQEFIPKDYYTHMKLESTRSGEYLGEDFPFNFLGKDRVWRSRKYNVIANPVPIDVSRVKCVDFYKRLQVWSTHWYENGIRRMRWFRCAYGFNRAKKAAEEFRKTLIMAGRVTDMKTESHKRVDAEKLRSIRLLKGKKPPTSS
ncbi:putative trophozoite protein [Theileria orientalis]|uniref:Trophozoite protein n=1 Tax=Theileria orientalis TaxID=68886 RepID=A0A976M515_THEOR|nr:putative trophozoite protein [Theileria orientalis]